MINFYDLVPSVYINASRDFQYLSWLINIVLNSVKHNVDDICELPNTKADPKLAELLSSTLGFKIRRNYDQKQLFALVSIIPTLLKYKGTKTAVLLAGRTLIAASGVTGDFECEIANNVLYITFPEELVDVALFVDLLPYILPAGIACNIVRKTKNIRTASTKIGYYDTLYADVIKDLSWDDSKQTSTGLSGLYTTSTPNFSNFKTDTDNQLALNAGLLSNTVIPTIDEPIVRRFNKNNEEDDT